LKITIRYLMDLVSTGSAKWDEKKEVSWKERMDDWKSKQGILGGGGGDPEDMDADVPL
jgi:cellulose synthase A